MINNNFLNKKFKILFKDLYLFYNNGTYDIKNKIVKRMGFMVSS